MVPRASLSTPPCRFLKGMSTRIISFFKRIAGWCRSVAASAREATPAARQVLRKRSVATYVMLRAYHAHFALVVAVVVLIFVAAPVVDHVTGYLFPGKSSEKLFGLVKAHSKSDIKTTLDPIIMTVLWVAAMGWTLLLFWRHMPVGLARAEARSQALAGEADIVASTDRVRSLALYRRARDLTVDVDRISALTTKIEELGYGLSPHTSQRPTLVDATAATKAPSRAVGDTHSVGPEGRYSLSGPVGKGSMGEVYRAWDRVLDREVALKQLSTRLLSDPQYAERFRHEAKALAQLMHPHVVQVYDFVEEDGTAWMVLELVTGGDLESYLEEHGRLEVAEAAAFAHQTATGLAHAHAQGIVHRDLKPANILLSADRQVKISDFGIAKMLRATNLTQEGAVLGSPPYMSPEQASGAPVDSRTDIYSLGITFYEMLTGKVPFDGDTQGVLAKHIIETPKPPSEIVPGLSSEVERVVLHMLEKQPDNRPADMNAVAEMLAPHAQSRSAPAPQSV